MILAYTWVVFKSLWPSNFETVYMSVPRDNWRVAYVCLAQWKVIVFVTPPRITHCCNLRLCHALYFKPMKTRSSGFPLSPNKPKACSDMGNVSAPLVFFCRKRM